ncbi:MAG: hypothetical protein JOZ19_02820 [Rubrobacter sp.]|nr:hypothetical protein [Rubrobacter sp.]
MEVLDALGTQPWTDDSLGRYQPLLGRYGDLCHGGIHQLRDPGGYPSSRGLAMVTRYRLLDTGAGYRVVCKLRVVGGSGGCTRGGLRRDLAKILYRCQSVGVSNIHQWRGRSAKSIMTRPEKYKQALTASERAYKALLVAYPKEFRTEYGQSRWWKLFRIFVP